MNNIGINGFGRIGRSILRIIVESNSDLNVIAINDLGDRENLVYLFKHDSIMGVLDLHVELKGDDLIVGDRTIKLISHDDPANIPWNDLGVDLVVESTGFFRDKSSLEKHISSGAKKVVLTVPPKDEINSFFDEKTTKDDLYRIIGITYDPIVSSDVVGNSLSGIVDGLSTMCIDDNKLKLIIWFDNGWGYASRIIEAVTMLGSQFE